MPLSVASFAKFRSLRANGQVYVDVRLVGPHGTRSIAIATLLDTGAAWSVFDQALAASVGHVVASLPTTSIVLANGAAIALPTLVSADLDIEGMRVTVGRILLTSRATTPLLSTGDMLLRSTFGLDASALYFD